MNLSKLNIAFFGSPEFAVFVLDELRGHGVIPSLIISQPDKPAGRKLTMTPPAAKKWAVEHGISTFQPTTLKDPEVVQAVSDEGPWDIFIVAAYGKIIPKEVLDLPKYGALNIHPSLLPKLRGASPIQSSILTEDATGVSIMLMDEQMDHGPILDQETTDIQWPPKASELEKETAVQGARMIAEILPKWISGSIKEKPQDDSQATYCKKIKKEDALIDLEDDPEKNFRKIQAFSTWPRAFFFTEKNGKKNRVIITDAAIEDGKLIIKKVIPEGRKEMSYDIFIQN